MSRTLDSRNVTIREELTLTTHAGMGYRMVMRGGICVADESPDVYARAAGFAFDADPRGGKSIAWIGGGMCVGPRLFNLLDCHQTVYEIEQSLEEFCPEGVTFMGGDWRDTISGQYDVIIFDLGGPAPYDELARFLNTGGVILPKEPSSNA